MPVLIVTHRQQSPIRKEEGTTYTFVSDGIEAALDRARAAAGGKDFLVVGGANVARQYLEAGLLDEIHVHIVPILLGGGAPLFEGVGQLGLQPTRSIESAAVTHLSYTVMT
jgi:dihydrofolate reductase